MIVCDEACAQVHFKVFKSGLCSFDLTSIYELTDQRGLGSLGRAISPRCTVRFRLVCKGCLDTCFTWAPSLYSRVLKWDYKVGQYILKVQGNSLGPSDSLIFFTRRAQAAKPPSRQAAKPRGKTKFVIPTILIFLPYLLSFSILPMRYSHELHIQIRPHQFTA